jgi:hypothetical protein
MFATWISTAAMCAFWVRGGRNGWFRCPVRPWKLCRSTSTLVELPESSQSLCSRRYDRKTVEHAGSERGISGES